jgi:hypothetical protein
VRRLALCSILLLSACGRGPVGALGGFDQDGGASDGASFDTGVPFDTGPFFDAGDPGDASIRDRGVRDTGATDLGGVPDFGVPDAAVECRVPRDCINAFGRPPFCPSGMPGRWLCNGGICEADCPCRSDCECPFETACIAGGCQPAGRNNLCCTNPACRPGDFCQEPGGGSGVCPAPDAGIIPDGGGPDSGRRDSGLPDGNTFPDLGFFDAQVFDGNVPDVGPFDVGVFDAGTPDGGAGTPVGDPCAAQGLCGPVGFCIEEFSGFPGGYCSQGCGGAGLTCPSGAVCRGFGQGQEICLDDCVTNAECRAGYACVQLGVDPTKVCWPVDPGSNNPNGEPVGGACGDNQDCDQGLSCLDFMGWPDGYCTKQFCDPANNPCPNGSSCFAFSGVFSLCLDDCPSGGTQSTCRNDYYCLGPIGQPGGCVPN